MSEQKSPQHDPDEGSFELKSDQIADPTELVPMGAETSPFQLDDIPSGTTIGRYEIVRTLGKGGFGVVYLARDQTLERKVAVKLSRLVQGDGHRSRISLIDEARASAGLDHPNIIRIYDVSQWKNCAFIVMEYVEGRSLAEQIASGNRIPLSRVLAILKQVATALVHMHSNGVIHRDLRPANILLGENDHVKVTDLGLALTDTSPLWSKKHFAGTRRYMAPEQVLGEIHRLDGRTDIWAFGVVAYEMITLLTPFRGDSPESLVANILKGDYPPARQRRPDVPECVERMCARCLSIRMADRFASAKDLCEAMEVVMEEVARKTETSIPDSGHEMVDAVPLTGAKSSTEPAGSETAKSIRRQSAESVSPSLGEEIQTLRGVIPRGLRAFGPADSEYYHNLMPGPYDMRGVPAVLNHWVSWVESVTDPTMQAVGVIYGPSGCGKSSFVQAALIPRIRPSIQCVYFNFTVKDPMGGLIRSLHERFPSTSSMQDLSQIFAFIRDSHDYEKTLLVFDQFEQYLFRTELSLEHELVRALRQCDANHLQTIILIRDEFWTQTSEFLQLIETTLADGTNALNVPHLNKRHARRILECFGRAYEMLPRFAEPLTPSQVAFLDIAIDGLAVDGTVLPVHISMFVELMKHYSWEKQTIVKFGGIDGAVSRYLHDAFHASDAPMSNRLAAVPCCRILAALTPDDGTELKSSAKDLSELANSVGESVHSPRLQNAIQCLESSLRLITVASSEPGVRQYALAHDYLVRPIKAWLRDQEDQTLRGRTLGKLQRAAVRYQREPINANTLGMMDWICAAVLLERRSLNSDQCQVFRASSARNLLKGTASITALVLLTWICFLLWHSLAESQQHRLAKIDGDIEFFLHSKSGDVAKQWEEMKNQRLVVADRLALKEPYFQGVSLQRLELLHALLGSHLSKENSIPAVKSADPSELEVWLSAFENGKLRDQAAAWADEDDAVFQPILHALFLFQQDYRLLPMLLKKVEDADVAKYRIMSVLSSQSDEKLLRLANAWIDESRKTGVHLHREFLTSISLQSLAMIIKQETLANASNDLKAMIAERCRHSNSADAVFSQWLDFRLTGTKKRWRPANEAANWRLHEPFTDEAFVMIQLRPGALTYSAQRKGTKELETRSDSVDENIWVASEEVSQGLIRKYFDSIGGDPSGEWDSSIQNSLGVRNITPENILHFCNWLSELEGRKPAFVFSNDEPLEDNDWIPLRTIKDVYWDRTANGFRVMTESEYRYASVQGDYDFWNCVWPYQAMRKRAFVTNQKDFGSSPTHFMMPDAWGFHELIGGLGDSVITNEGFGWMLSANDAADWPRTNPFAATNHYWGFRLAYEDPRS